MRPGPISEVISDFVLLFFIFNYPKPLSFSRKAQVLTYPSCKGHRLLSVHGVVLSVGRRPELEGGECAATTDATTSECYICNGCPHYRATITKEDGGLVSSTMKPFFGAPPSVEGLINE